MDARKLWYEEKKEYIESVLSDKKILFANVYANGTAKLLKEKGKKYDIIVGYNKAHDVFIVCEAKNFTKNKTASFKCVLEYFELRNSLNVGYRRSGERVIIFSNNKLSDFASNFNYYMYTYKKREDKHK